MMRDIERIDYAVLDRPEILLVVFHPRKEWIVSGIETPGQDVLIPVEEGIVVGSRFHITDRSAPNVIFFHGNGEIVADYDDLGTVYNRMDINFLVVDYRGYGQSTGEPTITAMMRDCHVIFDFVKEWLLRNSHTGPIILMGRSLGSASALELAARYKDQIGGLIVESGFAYAGPLLQMLGINVAALGFNEEHGFRNVDKIRSFDNPTLIIHAERDHIIPFSEGQTLFDSCQSTDKTLLKIPEANHNNIFLRGSSEYLRAVKALADRVKREVSDRD